MTEGFHAVRIGPVEISGNLFLAPLAGFSDLPFRSLCTIHGADCSITEMLSAEGFIRNNKKTLDLLRRSPEEKFFGVQIFSASPYSASKAVREIAASKPSFIDLNCGCPVPKVVKTGAGAALLRNPRFIYDIVKAMKDASDIPISVKIRSGWDEKSLNFLETSDAAVMGGASMVCLHARTRVQGYSGKADWRQIEILKERCPVPIFGSGDLFSPEAARDMLRETRCDGVMFARGALFNSFIFRETKVLLGTGSYVKPTIEERLALGTEHLLRNIEFKGEKKACLEMRKFFCYYLKGAQGSAKFRNRIVQASSFMEYENIAKEFLEASKSRLFPSDSNER